MIFIYSYEFFFRAFFVLRRRLGFLKFMFPNRRFFYPIKSADVGKGVPKRFAGNLSVAIFTFNFWNDYCCGKDKSFGVFPQLNILEVGNVIKIF
jgi:hypothetical protein